MAAGGMLLIGRKVVVPLPVDEKPRCRARVAGESIHRKGGFGGVP